MFFHVQKRKLETLKCSQGLLESSFDGLFEFFAGNLEIVTLKVPEILLKTQKEAFDVQKISQYVSRSYTIFAEGCEL